MPHRDRQENGGDGDKPSSPDVNQDGSIYYQPDEEFDNPAFWTGARLSNSYRGDCPNCGHWISRRRDDAVLQCKRCGMTAGLPFLRYLTHRLGISRYLPRKGPVATILFIAFVSIAIIAATSGTGVPVIDQAATAGAGSLATLFNTTTNQATATPSENPHIDGEEWGDETTPTQTESYENTGDTDGDGLSNRAESRGQTSDGFALPNSNPQKKDLYLIVYTEAGTSGLSDEEKADLQEIWAQMPVSNPNGEDGINLHIEERTRESIQTVTINDEGFKKIRNEIYSGEIRSTPAACNAYVSVLVPSEGSSQYNGIGASPGYLHMVDRDSTETYDTEYSVRTASITHELLHNIVGEFDDGTSHTEGGWLNGESEVHGEGFYMSDTTATHLSESGFAESEYYKQTYC